MAEMATYVGIEPRSINLTAAAVSRGIRVTRNSSGLCAAQDATKKGDYVTLQSGAASETISAASLGGGGKVPALASEAVAVGDLAYSAAAGKFSKTSTSAVLVGRWTQAASGDGVLGEVELFNVE